MKEKISFNEYLTEIFGDELDSFKNHAPVSDFVRINPLRTTFEEVQSILGCYGFKTEIASRATGALRLLEAPFDPTTCLHHYAGFFVKQALSSQIPPLVLDPKPHEKVLDLCASPGSKTTQIAALMQQQGLCYANDLSAKRMIPLAARLDATQASNTILLSHRGEELTQWFEPTFDKILADVPCSGLGIKDNLNENQYRYEKCASREAFYAQQYRLLLAACKMLKVGGRVVYSTCSLNPSENECIIHDIVSRLPIKLLPIPAIDGLNLRPGLTAWKTHHFDSSLSLTRRVTPWENDTRGFFIALLEKQEELSTRHHYTPDIAENRSTLPATDPDVREILENISYFYGIPTSVFEKHSFILNNRAIFILDATVKATLPTVYRAGLCLAKRRSHIWRLSHACIQKFSKYITKNKLILDQHQMEEIAATGWLKPSPTQPETPYPVLAYPPLGCLASTYAEADGIYWKRPCAMHVL